MSKSNSGYFYVSLYKDTTMESVAVHRLVAETFVQNDYSHSIVFCKTMKGENNCLAKLTTKEVIIVKQLLNTNIFSQREIADKYNVSQRAISLIKTNKTWSHVKEVNCA